MHLQFLLLQWAQKRSYYTPFLRVFQDDHVIVEMIARPKLFASHSYGTLGQALPPVSAVMKSAHPLSLSQKQEERLGPGCPKTGCPLILALLSFQQLHG